MVDLHLHLHQRYCGNHREEELFLESVRVDTSDMNWKTQVRPDGSEFGMIIPIFMGRNVFFRFIWAAATRFLRIPACYKNCTFVVVDWTFNLMSKWKGFGFNLAANKANM